MFKVLDLSSDAATRVSPSYLGERLSGRTVFAGKDAAVLSPVPQASRGNKIISTAHSVDDPFPRKVHVPVFEWKLVEAMPEATSRHGNIGSLR